MKKIITLSVLLIFLLSGCGGDTIGYTGLSGEVGPISVDVTINTNGAIVLGASYSQRIIGIDGLGVNWITGFETTLYEAKNSSNSLFILWEDASGKVWQEQYRIGEEFEVNFNNASRVRKIQGDSNGNWIVFVEPTGQAPGYDNLRDDIKDLVQRWDRAHKEADGPAWDTSNLDSVLRGAALQEQLSTVNLLRSKNCYWTIDELMTPQITRFEVKSSNSLLVEVRKNWNMDLYCNGGKSGDDDGSFTMYYEIEKVSGQWYITYKQVK